MRLLRFVPLLAVAALAACSTTGPIPYDRSSEPHALVVDSHEPAVAGAVPSFFVTEVDGWGVKGDLDANGHRTGRDATHTLAVNRPVSLEITGQLVFENSVKTIFWDSRRVSGRLQFTPAVDARYVVRGSINADSSQVWLEDERTHEQVGQKFSATPAPAASVPDMRTTGPQ